MHRHVRSLHGQVTGSMPMSSHAWLQRPATSLLCWQDLVNAFAWHSQTTSRTWLVAAKVDKNGQDALTATPEITNAKLPSHTGIRGAGRA